MVRRRHRTGQARRVNSPPKLAELASSGLDPIDVAARLLAAIRGNELCVFTHPGASWRSELAERFDAILTAMDKAAGRQGI